MACIQLELAVAVTDFWELCNIPVDYGSSNSSVTELSLRHAHTHLLLSGNLVPSWLLDFMGVGARGSYTES